MATQRAWSNADEVYLQENYNKQSWRKLAHALDRSEGAVKSRVSFLGLKREKVKKKPAKGKGIGMKPIALPVAKNLKKYADRARTRKHVDPIAGKVPLYIDHKTTVYIPAGASEKDIAAIRKQYTKDK